MSKKSTIEDNNIFVRIFSTVITFLTEVKAEMKKVSWPTKSEVTASTNVVLIAVGIVAVWIFAADQISGFVINGLTVLMNSI